ncbi:helix-turn-helix transcriptional regulator [Cohnella phaseoli]|uniref:AraC-like DNA-binding protein n=1 Tax=Cohnella phaseoli TaxID=456490 RepID=A0A3D9IRT0_9BACL|nr:helix-turn-helix transcriptional regulator [Cohnella phaseoli]RED64405.1 AraC-like DNA-binding protein [Cohnella phaseoli]
MFPARLRFAKSVMVILIVITIAMIPFTLLLSRQFTEFASDEINRFNQDKVVQTANNMDFFLTNLKVFGINIYEDQRIQNWLMAKQQDIEAQQVADNAMKLYLTTQPFIRKSYLINFRSESVLDSAVGQVRFSQFEDQQILLDIKNHRQPFLRYFNHTVDKESYLALIYPSTPSRIDYYGYLVLLLNKEMLHERLLTNNLPNTINYVTDENGVVVIGNDEFPHGEEWKANAAALSSQEWTFHSYNRLQTLRGHIDLFNDKIVLNFSGLLLLLVLIAAWNATRTYRPIAKLYKLIQGRMDKHSDKPRSDEYSSGGEIHYIRDRVEFLLNSVDKMNHERTAHRDLIREEYLRQWILQGKRSRSIRETIDNESRLAQCPYLYLAVIRMESYHALCERYNFYSRKLLKFAMGNIASEIIRNEGWEMESVDLGTDHLVLLIGRQEETEFDYIPVIERVGEQIEVWLQISNVAASSRAVRADDDLRKLYDNVMELTMLKFVSGEDKVYMPDDLRLFAETYPPPASEMLLDKIIDAVRLGKTEDVSASLERLFLQLQNLTHEKLKLQLIFITYSLFKAFSKLKAVQNEHNILLLLESFDTLQQYRTWLEKLIQEVSDKINVPVGNGRKNELASEIAQYAKDHLNDPMLTQEQIASHLSLSYSYVRSVFKEVHGITLADFILEERLRFAMELLLHTKSAIPDIAEKSGFQSKSYFFTVFKKKTGLTPNEYRLTQKSKRLWTESEDREVRAHTKSSQTE